MPTQAQDADELGFTVGDVIVVTQQYDDGWWLGRLADGRSGAFPSNYVRPSDQETAQQPDTAANSPDILGEKTSGENFVF